MVPPVTYASEDLGQQRHVHAHRLIRDNPSLHVSSHAVHWWLQARVDRRYRAVFRQICLRGQTSTSVRTLYRVDHQLLPPVHVQVPGPLSPDSVPWVVWYVLLPASPQTLFKPLLAPHRLTRRRSPTCV